ncbi:MAG: hypothetical protein WEA99_10760 [Brumimicrobium sp.]
MDFNREIRIRIYKAIENLEACQRFADGHGQVLASYGIKKVTSSDTKWFYNKDVYMVMVESVSGDKVFGGARLHLKNESYKLPLEKAIENIDPRINTLVLSKDGYKTGELCGLWNTKSMSGSGLSAILIRVGVAKAGLFAYKEFNLKYLFTLSSPWTINMVKDLGFEIETSIGQNGGFDYPTPEFKAYVLKLKDINNLKKAKVNERKNIFNLRENPIQRRTENGPKGKIEVEYNLIFSNTEKTNNLQDES